MKNSKATQRESANKLGKAWLPKTQATIIPPIRTKKAKENYQTVLLPPMAPHNTTQEIIDFHPPVLYEIDELLGYSANFIDCPTPS
jgi:hypothetical protein